MTRSVPAGTAIGTLLAPGGRGVLDLALSPAPPQPALHPLVVMLDSAGRPNGTAPKDAVHGPSTPLHLAFSCYVVDDTGRVLLTRRAAAKRTWPSTWTNACCGHPQPGESLRQAIERHLDHELGTTAADLAVALPDFSYRATMADGTVEHELCPVAIATVATDIVPNLDETDALEWVDWPALVARARHRPGTLSPWSVAQIQRLQSTIGDPSTWLRPPPTRRNDRTVRSRRHGASIGRW